MWCFELYLNGEDIDIAKRVYCNLKCKTKGQNVHIKLAKSKHFLCISFTCDLSLQNSMEYYISEQILEIVCVNCKRKYLDKYLFAFEDSSLRDLLLDALVEFDKNTDYYMLHKSIKQGSKIYLSSFVDFCLQNLKEKWDGLIGLTNNNYLYFCSSKSIIEFIKFIVESLEINVDIVNVIVEGEKIKLFDKNFKSISLIGCNIISHLISLSPRIINCYLGKQQACSDVKTIFDIFTNRVVAYSLESLM